MRYFHQKNEWNLLVFKILEMWWDRNFAKFAPFHHKMMEFQHLNLSWLQQIPYYFCVQKCCIPQQTFTFEELSGSRTPIALLNNISGARFTELLSTTLKTSVLYRLSSLLSSFANSGEGSTELLEFSEMKACSIVESLTIFDTKVYFRIFGNFLKHPQNAAGQNLLFSLFAILQ